MYAVVSIGRTCLIYARVSSAREDVSELAKDNSTRETKTTVAKSVETTILTRVFVLDFTGYRHIFS